MFLISLIHALVRTDVSGAYKSAAKLLLFCDMHKSLGKIIDKKLFFANKR